MSPQRSEGNISIASYGDCFVLVYLSKLLFIVILQTSILFMRRKRNGRKE